MKIFKRIISIIAVCALLIFFMKGFRFLVNDDTRSLTRITIHDFYSDKQNIDVCFIGSSHCYRSYNPEIADDMLKMHSFNLGTSSQRIDGSLAVLKELNKYNDVSLVVLDIYYDIIETNTRKERTELTSTYVISDYLRPSINKVEYLLDASSKDYYVNSFIVGRRSWNKLLDNYYVKELVKRKLTFEYLNYDSTFRTGNQTYYVSRGFWANDSLLIDYERTEEETKNIHINVSDFCSEWKESLKQIIDLCNREGISLVLVASPIPQSTFMLIDNYDEYVAYVNSQLEGTGVQYFDFNQIEEGKELANDEMLFMDDDHLNRNGADQYTRLLCDLLLKKGII